MFIIIYKELEMNRITKYNFETVYNRYMSVLTGGAQEASSITERSIFKEHLMLREYVTDRRQILSAMERLLELNVIKISGLGASGTVQSISKLQQSNIRLNELHPSEIHNFIKEHAKELPQEAIRFAL